MSRKFNRLVALGTLILAQYLVFACANPTPLRPITREIAIEIASKHLVRVATCLKLPERTEAEFFQSGDLLRAKFPFRGEKGEVDYVEPKKAYWSVLFIYKTNSGRKLPLSVTIDAGTEIVKSPPINLPREICTAGQS